jgi:hypothetical protein
MRFRVNLRLDGAPSLSLERHESRINWMALRESSHAHENDAQYNIVARSAPS